MIRFGGPVFMEGHEREDPRAEAARRAVQMDVPEAGGVWTFVLVGLAGGLAFAAIVGWLILRRRREAQ